MDELQRHILHDIIGHIDVNVQLGNITVEDALKLKRNLQKLCDYLSKHHKELEGMRDMTDESFMTDIDIMCKIHEQCVEKLEARVRELENKLKEKEADLTDESFMTDIDIMCKEHEEAMAQKDKEHEERVEKLESAMAQKDIEIAMLKKQLEELQNNN